MIGVIADFRIPDYEEAIIDFARDLHKMERSCHLLIFVPDVRKELNSFQYEKHFPGMPVEVVCQDDLNTIKMVPKKFHLPFSSKTYDILFRLETRPNFSMDTVVYQTEAKMYAGKAGSCNGIMDFEIEIQDGAALKSLTDNLISYLKTIQSLPEEKQVANNQTLF